MMISNIVAHMVYLGFMFRGGEMLSTWAFLLCLKYGNAHFVLQRDIIICGGQKKQLFRN